MNETVKAEVLKALRAQQDEVGRAQLLTDLVRTVYSAIKFEPLPFRVHDVDERASTATVLDTAMDHLDAMYAAHPPAAPNTDRQEQAERRLRLSRDDPSEAYQNDLEEPQEGEGDVRDLSRPAAALCANAIRSFLATPRHQQDLALLSNVAGILSAAADDDIARMRPTRTELVNRLGNAVHLSAVPPQPSDTDGIVRLTRKQLQKCSSILSAICRGQTLWESTVPKIAELLDSSTANSHQQTATIWIELNALPWPQLNRKGFTPPNG
jgi:hypothetical protein